jgi:hypothetical protein
MTGKHFRKRALAAVTVGALIMVTSAANAALVTFTGYGATPANETLITNFSSDAGLTGSYLLETGTTGDYAAPAISAIWRDPNQYLAVEGGDAVTLKLGKSYHDVSIYIGSLDSYNGLSFSNGSSFTGGALATLTGATDNGDQQSSSSNGLLTFEFATAVDSVKFTSGTNAFEVASVSAAVPEVSTWAMMLLGFAGLGFVAHRRTSAAWLHRRLAAPHSHKKTLRNPRGMASRVFAPATLAVSLQGLRIRYSLVGDCSSSRMGGKVLY